MQSQHIPADTVVIDRTRSPTAFRFARRFNVAVPFIDRHVKDGRGSRIAIRSVLEDISYATLAERVSRCGNALVRLGISPGERLLMVVKDSPEFFYVFWGAIKAGIVPIPVNTVLRAEDYKFLIEDTACAALVYSAEFVGAIETALDQVIHRPRRVLPVEAADGANMLSAIGEAPATLAAFATNADTECFWLYSSGSTDRPKGVIHCHRDMVITSQLYGVDVLGICSDDVCFSAAKLYFAYGLGNAMTFPLWVGATAIVLADRPTTQSIFAIIERFRPTLYFAVPTLYAAHVQALETSRPNLSSIRLCVSAGEALPHQLYRRWHDLTGTAILDGVGSTEALHIFISNLVDGIRIGTSGRAVPGYEAKLVDEHGKSVRQGQMGQLYIRGDSVAQYYWSHFKRSRCTTSDGWLNTGDVFVKNADGDYVYHGRRDDMLKVNGSWCSPFEIESILCLHPGVLEAAVVGRADANGLIKPEAWVVMNEQTVDPAKIERELVQHCKAKLTPDLYPRWFHFVSRLPKTASGKVQRSRLRAAAPESRRAQRPGSAAVA